MTSRIVICVGGLALIGCGASGDGAPLSEVAAIDGSQPVAAQGGDDSGTGTGAPPGEGTTVVRGDDAAAPPSPEGDATLVDDSRHAFRRRVWQRGDSGASTTGDAGGGCSGASPGPLVGWASVSGLERHDDHGRSRGTDREGLDARRSQHQRGRDHRARHRDQRHDRGQRDGGLEQDSRRRRAAPRSTDISR